MPISKFESNSFRQGECTCLASERRKQDQDSLSAAAGPSYNDLTAACNVYQQHPAVTPISGWLSCLCPGQRGKDSSTKLENRCNVVAAWEWPVPDGNFVQGAAVDAGVGANPGGDEVWISAGGGVGDETAGGGVGRDESAGAFRFARSRPASRRETSK